MNQTIPSKQGQVCKMIAPKPSDKATEVYIVVDNAPLENRESIICVVSLTQLQKHQSNPSMAPKKVISRTQLMVVAEDLTSYIDSFNK